MSQTTSNQANTANQKEYHTPKLRKFGNVSDLTLTNAPPPFSGNDGGSFPNFYAS